MADDYTKLLDAVTPEVYNAYMEEYTKERSALIQSGVAVSDPRVSANITNNTGGTMVNMPFWHDLTGEDEVLGDGDKALTTANTTAGNMLAPVLYRGKGWAANEMVAVIAGSDPMKSIMDKFGAWWLRREQAIMVSVLKGLFAEAAGSGDSATPAGALVATHFLPGTAVFDRYTVLNAKQLLGDASDQLAAIMVHSAIYTSMQKLDLIDFIKVSENQLQVPFYQGYRVIVDDSVPVGGTANAPIYTSYLMAAQTIGRNSGTPSDLTTFETDRDKATGTNKIYTRKAEIMHPYGLSWTNTVREPGNLTPTNSDLANPANYKMVFEPKNIGIVAFKSKPIA